MSAIDAILKKYWGYETFRPLQREIIDSVTAGRDTVALLPTGGGKSLTYQIPALASGGLTIVVTPLIALMKDQVDALRRRGIKAVAVNSSMQYREIDVALDNCVYGDVKLLYIAPERIDTQIFRQRVVKMPVSLIAVDEAHCISEWGYDFRPSYLKISLLRDMLPGVPVLALTATATSLVLRDIVFFLKLDGPMTFRGSFARPNLSFIVRRGDNKLEQILRVTGKVPGSGIIYTRTRSDSEQIAAFLKSKGIAADYYHAGLGFRVRNLRQQEWMEGKTRVVVATNAFGMGIDKADVRFVLHYQIPESIEAYYQEAGRAGRDGERAYAVAMYNEGDDAAARRRIEMEYPPLAVIRNVYESLFNYLQVSIGGGKGEIYDFRLGEFAARFRIFSATALNALKILELNGYLTLTDEMDNPTRVMFRIGRDDLYRVQVDRAELDGLLKVLLRSYTGLFSGFVPIDEKYLERVSGYTEQRIIDMLMELARMKVIHLIPRRNTPLLILSEERLPVRDVVISPSTYQRRREQSELRSAAVIEYAASTDECRSLILRRYFDEEAAEPCGVCDVCIERRRSGAAPPDRAKIAASIEKLVADLLSDAASRYDLRMLVARIPGSSVEALNAVRRMIASSRIGQNPDGSLRLIR